MSKTILNTIFLDSSKNVSIKNESLSSTPVEGLNINSNFLTADVDYLLATANAFRLPSTFSTGGLNIISKPSDTSGLTTWIADNTTLLIGTIQTSGGSGGEVLITSMGTDKNTIITSISGSVKIVEPTQTYGLIVNNNQNVILSASDLTLSSVEDTFITGSRLEISSTSLKIGSVNVSMSGRVFIETLETNQCTIYNTMQTIDNIISVNNPPSSSSAVSGFTVGISSDTVSSRTATQTGLISAVNPSNSYSILQKSGSDTNTEVGSWIKATFLDNSTQFGQVSTISGNELTINREPRRSSYINILSVFANTTYNNSTTYYQIKTASVHNLNVGDKFEFKHGETIKIIDDVRVLLVFDSTSFLCEGTYGILASDISNILGLRYVPQSDTCTGTLGETTVLVAGVDVSLVYVNGVVIVIDGYKYTVSSSSYDSTDTTITLSSVLITSPSSSTIYKYTSTLANTINITSSGTVLAGSGMSGNLNVGDIIGTDSGYFGIVTSISDTSGTLSVLVNTSTFSTMTKTHTSWQPIAIDASADATVNTGDIITYTSGTIAAAITVGTVIRIETATKFGLYVISSVDAGVSFTAPGSHTYFSDITIDDPVSGSSIGIYIVSPAGYNYDVYANQSYAGFLYDESNNYFAASSSNDGTTIETSNLISIKGDTGIFNSLEVSNSTDVVQTFTDVTTLKKGWNTSLTAGRIAEVTEIAATSKFYMTYDHNNINTIFNDEDVVTFESGATGTVSNTSVNSMIVSRNTLTNTLIFEQNSTIVRLSAATVDGGHSGVTTLAVTLSSDDIRVGDVLAVNGTGAYTVSLIVANNLTISPAITASGGESIIITRIIYGFDSSFRVGGGQGTDTITVSGANFIAGQPITINNTVYIVQSYSDPTLTVNTSIGSSDDNFPIYTHETYMDSGTTVATVTNDTEIVSSGIISGLIAGDTIIVLKRRYILASVSGATLTTTTGGLNGTSGLTIYVEKKRSTTTTATGTTISVADTSGLTIGEPIVVGGTSTTITSISTDTSITLLNSVTTTFGDLIYSLKIATSDGTDLSKMSQRVLGTGIESSALVNYKIFSPFNYGTIMNVASIGTNEVTIADQLTTGAMVMTAMTTGNMYILPEYVSFGTGTYTYVDGVEDNLVFDSAPSGIVVGDILLMGENELTVISITNFTTFVVNGGTISSTRNIYKLTRLIGSVSTFTNTTIDLTNADTLIRVGDTFIVNGNEEICTDVSNTQITFATNATIGALSGSYSIFVKTAVYPDVFSIQGTTLTRVTGSTDLDATFSASEVLFIYGHPLTTVSTADSNTQLTLTSELETPEDAAYTAPTLSNQVISLTGGFSVEGSNTILTCDTSSTSTSTLEIIQTGSSSTIAPLKLTNVNTSGAFIQIDGSSIDDTVFTDVTGSIVTDNNLNSNITEAVIVGYYKINIKDNNNGSNAETNGDYYAPYYRLVPS